MTFKVANIILDGRMAGPQNRILLVAEKLKRYGIETIVIIPRKNSGSFYHKLVQRNIQTKRMNLHRLTKHIPHLIGWFFFFISELIALYKFLKRENIALVHCNTPWQIKGILAGKMARAKVIWHLQDTRTSPAIKTLFKILAYLVCDGFIVAGASVRHYYFDSERLNKKKIAEIQAPVDTTRFNPNVPMKDKTMGKNSSINIASVGNINPNKGFEYFIEMAKILNKKYENLSFYIVGPYLETQKRYWRKLNRLVHTCGLRNFSFYGQSHNVPSVLQATHIFVCSSVTEASPMAVWEAMAMEKAVVSTNVGDVRRFIRDGKSGFIVPPADASQLAQKVSILIDDCDLRKRIGKFARATVVKELDIEVCVDKHRDFYVQYLGMKHRH
ncbi:MAG: glycosyltransferase [Candidatus Hodarchaeota archaeon]